MNVQLKQSRGKCLHSLPRSGRRKVKMSVDFESGHSPVDWSDLGVDRGYTVTREACADVRRTQTPRYDLPVKYDIIVDDTGESLLYMKWLESLDDEPESVRVLRDSGRCQSTTG